MYFVRVTCVMGVMRLLGESDWPRLYLTSARIGGSGGEGRGQQGSRAAGHAGRVQHVMDVLVGWGLTFGSPRWTMPV
jgi:hypothetical protein